VDEDFIITQRRKTKAMLYMSRTLVCTVKPGYKDPGYKDILTNKDTILSPEQICMRNKDNPTPLNILRISRSLVRKYTKFSLT